MFNRKTVSNMDTFQKIIIYFGLVVSAVALDTTVPIMTSDSTAEHLKCINSHSANMKIINLEIQESIEMCWKTYNQDIIEPNAIANDKRSELDNDLKLIITLLEACTLLESKTESMKCTSNYVSIVGKRFKIL